MSKPTGLKELIKSRGLRTDFVASKVGITPTTLRAISLGLRTTTLPVVKLLSQVLEVPEEELLKMGLMHDKAG
jgi:transcriptional regulator with XRE-family HTH domain